MEDDHRDGASKITKQSFKEMETGRRVCKGIVICYV
jgi:hypothetical protein